MLFFFWRIFFSKYFFKKFTHVFWRQNREGQRERRGEWEEESWVVGVRGIKILHPRVYFLKAGRVRTARLKTGSKNSILATHIVAMVQTLKPSYAVFSGAWGGNWIQSGVSRTQLGTPVLDTGVTGGTLIYWATVLAPQDSVFNGTFIILNGTLTLLEIVKS